mgnify:CR=1 FL=1
MAVEALLFMAATAAIAALITGSARYFGLTRLLRILLFLWIVLSVVLFLLALSTPSFDRRIFLSLWLYFALPAFCGGALASWGVGRIMGKGET